MTQAGCRFRIGASEGGLAPLRRGDVRLGGGLPSTQGLPGRRPAIDRARSFPRGIPAAGRARRALRGGHGHTGLLGPGRSRLLTIRDGGLGRWTRGQQRQRVEIRVATVASANAEVNVDVGVLGRPAPAGLAHDIVLVDARPPDHTRLPEVQQGHDVAVVGEDRDREAVARNGPGERDGPTDGREDGPPGIDAYVDAAVLTSRVWILHRPEPLDHRPLCWPAPGSGPSDADGQKDENHDGERETLTHVASVVRGVNIRSLAGR